MSFVDKEPDGKKVSYHPNGQIAMAMTYVDSRLSGRLSHGMTRSWYPNGTLQQEMPTRFGKVHGTVRTWSATGQLLGEYSMDSGTGVHRSWHPDGQPHCELPMLGGIFHGRQRIWLEDGGLGSVLYWVYGRKVSKKRYSELCGTDSTLPRYEDLRVSPNDRHLPVVKRPAEKTAEKRSRHDEFMTRLLNSRVAEARAWLRTSPEEDAFTLGELPTTRQSLELVEEAYAAGAVTVMAAEIADGDPGRQNSGTLVIELPKTKAKRKRIVAWMDEQAELQGFDPEADHGETHLFLRLD